MKKTIIKVINSCEGKTSEKIADAILENFNVQKKPKVDIEKFEQFWSLYPRKIAKKNALVAWSRVEMTNELFAKIVESVNTYTKSEQWIKDNGQYIPHPSTWLNQERWNDELDVITSTKYPN